MQPENPKSPEQKPDLRFRPLNKGLGFHAFSEGLPYAATPSGPTAPSGASQAGPVRFATPARIVPPPAPGPGPILSVTPPATKALQAESPAVIMRPIRSDAPSSFMPLKRVLAWLFDVALHTGLCVGALFFILNRMGIPGQSLLDPQTVTVFGAFLFVFNWALILAEEIAFGATPGKRLFGLVVEGTPAQLFSRSLLFVAGLSAAGLGLLPVIFRRDRQGLHDLLTGAYPREITGHLS